MHRIRVYSIGKTKETWLLAALAEYEERLRYTLTVEWQLLPDNSALIKALAQENWPIICLSPEGELLSSEAFSKKFLQILAEGGCRLNLVIGGAEGLPHAIKQQARWLVSLSRLTFTHQMTRLLLLEQIYRAFEIERGSPYHK